MVAVQKKEQGLARDEAANMRLFMYGQIAKKAKDIKALAAGALIKLHTDEVEVQVQEFNLEKLPLVEAEKKKIKQEYERKGQTGGGSQEDLDLQLKASLSASRQDAYSMQLNTSRLKVLQAQDDLVNGMKEAAAKALVNLSDDKKAYRKIIQGLIMLGFPSNLADTNNHNNFN
ncbi:hypothetical protein Cgig2_010657 [Carnegiea gigantea]|uniref:Uncharacterized protein n=1 Tax=Carnegiea gigantea TaxID=171969 RepID=A0A9Q1JM16_9CARY|nr:hypothetical protein Cgig2_010657 [Carnegiea gigantea]